MAVPSPDSFVVRLFTRDDLEAVLRLGKVTEAQQEAFWNTRGVHPETDHWVAISSDGKLAGYACIWQTEPPYLDLHIALAARAQEQEIRRALYQVAEQRIHSVVERTEPEEQTILRTNIDANHSEEQDFFERQGYLKAKGGYVMEVDLQRHALSPPVWPEEVTVCTFEEGSERSALSTLMQEIWPGFALPEEGFDPTLWFLARTDEQLIGAILCEEWIAYEKGAVNQLVVRAARREKGVGQALLLHAFQAFLKRGIVKVQLDLLEENEAAYRLYQRVGMQTIWHARNYEKKLQRTTQTAT